ncbi:hypothetical protein LINPERHAP1_LOCUS17519 [Linum perenne]
MSSSLSVRIDQMTNEARELGVPVWFMCMKK